MTIAAFIEKHDIEAQDPENTIVPIFPFRLSNDGVAPTCVGQSPDGPIYVALFADVGRFAVIKVSPAQRFEGQMAENYGALDSLD